MHSVTRFPGEDFDTFNVMSTSHRTDSVDEMELLVEELKVALEDAQVHLDHLRNRALDRVDAEREYEREIEALMLEDEYRERYDDTHWDRMGRNEPDGPPDHDIHPPANWEP